VTLSVSEAAAVNTVIRWAMGLPRGQGGELVSDADATTAARLLATKAQKTLMAGLRPDDVELYRPAVPDLSPGQPGTEPPLTCNGCLSAPATRLAVFGRTNADRTPAPGHVLRLLCPGCAARTQVICKAGGRMVTFLAVTTITAEDDAVIDEHFAGRHPDGGPCDCDQRRNRAGRTGGRSA
jgi:hypothetical protein